MPELELARARSWSAECQGAYVPTFWRPLYLGFDLMHAGHHSQFVLRDYCIVPGMLGNVCSQIKFGTEA